MKRLSNCTPEEIVERNKYYRDQRKERNELCHAMLDYECERCGYYHYNVMEYHHLDPTQKKFTIGRHILRKSMDAILIELKKCALLCANCHKIVHNGEPSRFLCQAQ